MHDERLTDGPGDGQYATQTPSEWLHLPVTREVARKLERLPAKDFAKKGLRGGWRFNIPSTAMPNEPATDKVIISFQIPVAVKVRLQKEARERKMTFTAYVSYLLHEGVKDVNLAPEDYEEIARQIRANEAKRKRKRIG